MIRSKNFDFPINMFLHTLSISIALAFSLIRYMYVREKIITDDDLK